MKLIVGLGNPGNEYVGTRHNIGFVAIDLLLNRHAPGAPARQRFHSATWDVRIADEKCLLMKPLTFMNRSGLAVRDAIQFYKVETHDVMVLVDDVALDAGNFRLRERGSDGGHNGLADIQQLLGSDEYPRLRIGVDPPGRIPRKHYVLGKFTPDQVDAIDGVLGDIGDAVEYWVEHGMTEAMNRYNRRRRATPAADDDADEATPGSSSS